jgi:peptide/nickel transport system permease protein
VLVYLVKRLIISAGLVWLVATLIFLALYLVPGDPAEMLLSGGGVQPDRALVENLREKLGLHRPLMEQYLAYLGNLARFDLGVSFQDEAPVAAEVAKRLPRTLELILAAVVLALSIGMPIGIRAAIERNGPVDRAASYAASLFQSVPVFVIGTLFVLVFATKLRWVPAGGFVAFSANPSQHLLQLLMPSVTIAIPLSAVVFRMTRTAVLETLDREWVRTARANGLPESQVMRRHVVRNALGPVVTIVGLQMGTLLGGTVLVEYVFNWPGLSGYLVRAVEQRDYPEVRGIVLVISILFVMLNLIVDVLYAVIDPRVRHS